ncbi:vWA domain-containing protein [[Clostridium] colinum]|uniref:vWA domain-containing protein n=1 Tax=[Clostridium] colinum TaxID=36835 RepID=UPI0020259A3F|nr:VWA domain-containing protein [[Clostridium] colinum]
MGLNLSNKLIDKDNILCNETFFVTLALSASPDIQSNPTDIALVLDRSGSMTGLPLEEVKIGAKTFIDIIEEATDGTPDGNIGSGSRIGIVSFSTDATKDVPLSTDVSTLKTAIDDLVAGGNTNHSSAFKKAMELFDPSSNNAKVIVMFTDGKTTVGPNPSIDAALARSLGITIYCIGLNGSGGIDITTLNDWATDPDNTHVYIAPTPDDLEEIFKTLAANISKVGATNIVIDEVLNSNFNIVEILTPNIGNASLINNTTLKWTINELGKTSNEGASLSFKVKYIGDSSGIFNVNESIQYQDNEGNIANFGNPEITIDCTKTVIVDPCPEPKNIVFENCENYLEYDLGDYALDHLGRILELSLTIKNVCPNKKVALAITVNEIDDNNTENKKAMKIISVPIHNSNACEDIRLTNIKFVLPEEDNLICKERKFAIRVIGNYIDDNPIC